MRSSSSAGNTRGLIEAHYTRSVADDGHVSLPRGIPAASLKRDRYEIVLPRRRRVFRGEYPRPH